MEEVTPAEIAPRKTTSFDILDEQIEEKKERLSRVKLWSIPISAGDTPAQDERHEIPAPEETSDQKSDGTSIAQPEHVDQPNQTDDHPASEDEKTEEASQDQSDNTKGEVTENSAPAPVFDADTTLSNSPKEQLLSNEAYLKQDIPEAMPTEVAVEIDNKISSARDVYAEKLAEWKKSVREKKSVVTRIFNDLGVERQVPQTAKPKELLDAEREYIKAKKEKVQTLIGFEALVEQVEKERALLEKKLKEIADAVPPKEKERLEKVYEWWRGLSSVQRVAMSSALMTAGGAAIFGSAGIAAMGGAVAYRMGRGLTGAGAAQVTGKFVDTILKGKYIQKSAEKRKKEALEKYGTSRSKTFEEKERELAEFFEKEERIRKRKNLYKAGAMVAVGGVANVGFNWEASGILHSTPEHVVTGSGATAHESSAHPSALSGSNRVPDHPIRVTDTPYSRGSEDSVGHARIDTPHTTPPAPETVVTHADAHVAVELSDKGFIKTFDNLKEKLVSEYGGADKVPAQYRHFVDTSSAKLAEEFGFYDAKNNLSGMGFKGESLELNEKGDLLYRHLDHSEKVIFEADHGEVNKFAGPMKQFGTTGATHAPTSPEPVGQPDSDSLYVEGGASHPTEASGATDLDETGQPYQHVDISDHAASAPSGVERMTYGGQTFAVSHATDGNHISWEHGGEATEIAHDVPFGPGDTKVPALHDVFQDGDQYASVRRAFVTAQENIMNAKNIGQQVIPVDFEGGRIHIIAGEPGLLGNPNTLHVLLNGKEIASGAVTENGSDVLFNKALGSSWWEGKTVYERAFESAKPIIKGLKIVSQ